MSTLDQIGTNHTKNSNTSQFQKMEVMSEKYSWDWEQAQLMKAEWYEQDQFK